MLQFDVPLRNARLDAIEDALGPFPILRIRSGAPPAHCSDPDFGTVIATLQLPADWMQAAANGSKSKSGSWQDLYADHSGVAGHFRIYTIAGICRIQGTVTVTGGGGDLTLSGVGISAGQYVTVLTFTISEQNA